MIPRPHKMSRIANVIVISRPHARKARRVAAGLSNGLQGKNTEHCAYAPIRDIPQSVREHPYEAGVRSRDVGTCGRIP